MSIKTINEIVKGIIFIGGLVCISYYSNWQTTAGVFLLIWANNFDFVQKG